MPNLRVVLGISGGIAAYKSASLIRLLVAAGNDVIPVPTKAALEFIGAATLEALSGHRVVTEVFDDVHRATHVQYGQSADLVIVAPATANTLAKLVAGRSDNLLTATVLATEAPVVVAPAMHSEMWMSRSTQSNVATLRARGFEVMEPATGALAGGDVGVGRMPEPEAIVDFANGIVHPKDMVGQHVLITAGGTREPLDAVRYLGNRSSGKQGIALARAAKARGAKVTLIAANVHEHVPSGINVVRVETTEELARAVLERAAHVHVICMAAAVADYRPNTVSNTKLKKDALGPTPTLELKRNPDILKGLVDDPAVTAQIIGFAAETAEGTQLMRLGRKKLHDKGCDFLVVNSVSNGRTFGDDATEVIVLPLSPMPSMSFAGTKLSVAHDILDITRRQRTR